MFASLEVSYLVIKAVRPLVRTIEHGDRDLAEQIRRAATSVSLNLAEGQRSRKGNRMKHYGIAHGSANEIKCGLNLAVALGHLDESAAVDALAILDRQLRLLWKLTNPSEPRRTPFTYWGPSTPAASDA
jgi:four helix bundle protein